MQCQFLRHIFFSIINKVWSSIDNPDHVKIDMPTSKQSYCLIIISSSTLLFHHFNIQRIGQIKAFIKQHFKPLFHYQILNKCHYIDILITIMSKQIQSSWFSVKSAKYVHIALFTLHPWTANAFTQGQLNASKGF